MITDPLSPTRSSQDILLLFLAVLCSLSLIAHAAAAPQTERPNFILYITDDITADDLGCYGHPVIQTPHLDQMAREGLLFTRAILTASSCSPSRCSLITGRYPHNTGAPELHTELPEVQPLFPEKLREAGYYTVLSGKHHMGPNANPAFEEIRQGQGPGGQEEWVDILRNRPKDRPFFFWFASADAHRGWQIDDIGPHYDPADVIVPPYMVDTPETRQDLAGYYHEVSRSDRYAGRLRQELERQGIAENTYLIYISDNGRPFPRDKTRMYESGIRSPLIVWAPGRIAQGVSDSLVSVNLDLGPTFLELAGVPVDPRMQGVSLTPILGNPSAVVRDFAFAEQNWHVYQAHQRLVRHGDWSYIRNAWPDLRAMSVESSPSTPSGAALWHALDEGTLSEHQKDIFLTPRPSEELYRVDRDPHQLENLADHEEYQETLTLLRLALDQWGSQTGDTVPDNPTPDREQPGENRRQNPPRGEFPGSASQATSINNPGPIRLADLPLGDSGQEN